MNTLIKNKKRFLGGLILFLLIILWTSFIFDMSTKTADESSKISGGLLRTILFYIKDLIWFDVEFSLLHNMFRKLAHFTEYAILGFLSVSFFTVINKPRIFCLIHCLSTAIFDEYLQYLTGAGRSMQISDMITDFSGSLTAVIIFYIISYIIFRIKNRKICHT